MNNLEKKPEIKRLDNLKTIKGGELNKEEVEKLVKISNQHNKTINEDEGFLLRNNFEDIFKNATRVHTDGKDSPVYVLIIYSNKDYENYIGKMPELKEPISEDYCHAYAVFKNKQEKGNYKDFLKNVFEVEKNNYHSKGLWVLISKYPFENKKSIGLHKSMGFEEVGEHSTVSEKQLDGRPIKWNVYIKKYN